MSAHNINIEELLKEFDPITREKIRNVTNYQNEILDLYDIAEYEGEEEVRGRQEEVRGHQEEVRGRCFIRWRFIRDLEKDFTPVFMEKNKRESKHIFLRKTYFFKSATQH